VPGQVDVEEFIEGTVCRRVILDQVMDSPREREGCEEGEEACDVCSRKGEDWFEDSGIGSRQAMDGVSSSPFNSSPSRSGEIREQDGVEIEEHQRQRDWIRSRVIRQRCKEGQEVKELVEYLEEWGGKCTLCHWCGGHDPKHKIEQCIRAEAGKNRMGD
jgi:hypothetical protein